MTDAKRYSDDEVATALQYLEREHPGLVEKIKVVQAIPVEEDGRRRLFGEANFLSLRALRHYGPVAQDYESDKSALRHLQIEIFEMIYRQLKSTN